VSAVRALRGRLIDSTGAYGYDNRLWYWGAISMEQLKNVDFGDSTCLIQSISRQFKLGI